MALCQIIYLKLVQKKKKTILKMLEFNGSMAIWCHACVMETWFEISFVFKGSALNRRKLLGNPFHILKAVVFFFQKCQTSMFFVDLIKVTQHCQNATSVISYSAVVWHSIKKILFFCENVCKVLKHRLRRCITYEGILKQMHRRHCKFYFSNGCQH